MAYTKIGKLGKRFGLEGFIRIQIDSKFEANWTKIISDNMAVFVGIDNFKIPFFVDSYDTSKELISFKRIRSEDELVELAGKDIFTDLLLTDDEHAIDFDSLKGYRIHDLTSGTTTGEIIRMDEYPAHPMAVVNVNDKEVLIPVVLDWIQHIDTSSRQVVMELPIGLL